MGPTGDSGGSNEDIKSGWGKYMRNNRGMRALNGDDDPYYSDGGGGGTMS